MADILKHGDTYAKIQCKECHAIIGFTKKDILDKSEAFDVWGNVTNIVKKWIICPECDSKNYLIYRINGEDV